MPSNFDPSLLDKHPPKRYSRDIEDERATERVGAFLTIWIVLVPSGVVLWYLVASDALSELIGLQVTAMLSFTLAQFIRWYTISGRNDHNSRRTH